MPLLSGLVFSSWKTPCRRAAAARQSWSNERNIIPLHANYHQITNYYQHNCCYPLLCAVLSPQRTSISVVYSALCSICHATILSSDHHWFRDSPASGKIVKRPAAGHRDSSLGFSDAGNAVLVEE